MYTIHVPHLTLPLKVSSPGVSGLFLVASMQQLWCIERRRGLSWERGRPSLKVERRCNGTRSRIAVPECMCMWSRDGRSAHIEMNEFTVVYTTHHVCLISMRLSSNVCVYVYIREPQFFSLLYARANVRFHVRDNCICGTHTREKIPCDVNRHRQFHDRRKTHQVYAGRWPYDNMYRQTSGSVRGFLATKGFVSLQLGRVYVLL